MQRPTLEARIRSDIEAKVRSGEWPPGYRIPFEHEFVTAYGCSRATVNKAISALRAAGLIERRKRAGSFVAHPPVHAALLDIPDIAGVLERRGDRYRFALIATEVLDSTAAQTLFTGREITGCSLLLSGLHIANERPFAHERRIISLEEVPEAEQVDFTGQAPGSWLLKHVPWTQARNRVSAINPAPATARLLKIPSAAACLQIERLTWRMNRPVTAVIQTFPGDRYDLVGQFTPSAKPFGTGGD